MDSSDKYVTSVRIRSRLQTEASSVADVRDLLIDRRHKWTSSRRNLREEMFAVGERARPWGGQCLFERDLDVLNSVCLSAPFGKSRCSTWYLSPWDAD